MQLHVLWRKTSTEWNHSKQTKEQQEREAKVTKASKQVTSVVPTRGSS